MSNYTDPIKLVEKEINNGKINKNNGKVVADGYFKAYKQVVSYVESEDKIVDIPKKAKGVETIKEIKEFETKSFSGFEIITNKQKITLGIDNIQDCCESWGYFMSNDNIKDFIGKKLTGIKITDLALNTKKVEEIGDLESGGMMFVDIETNLGVLQFVAYNSHNGYYGHEARVESKQLNHSENL
jgi:hypothetical protein